MPDYLKLKKSNCQNCYKCIRHCPVKSIRFQSSQAHIVKDECILCGQCFVVCPQNAKEIRNDVPIAEMFVKGECPVAVSLAPSFVANYPGATIETMRAALKKLGFDRVEETAVGASVVKTEYERSLKSVGRASSFPHAATLSIRLCRSITRRLCRTLHMFCRRCRRTVRC